MKIVLVLCYIAVVTAVVAGCGRRKSQADSQASKDVLDYDKMVLLDAEDLGEGSIGSSYKADVVPVLKQYVTSPAEVTEQLDPKGNSYKVICQGQAYVVYSPDMDLSQGQNWGNATFALFDIVNRQLQGSSVRFYAINGGNDLGGMFLDQQTYDRALKSLSRKQDRPYLPRPEPPWYGQEHDD